MDGRGRWMDNVFIERLWRSLKYECVYLHAFETGSELRAGLAKWIGYYNHASEHPFVYVVEGNRHCWSGCDPVGYLEVCRARSVLIRAAGVASAVRAKIQRAVGQGMDRLNLAGLCRQSERLGRDMQEACGLAKNLFE